MLIRQGSIARSVVGSALKMHSDTQYAPFLLQDNAEMDGIKANRDKDSPAAEGDQENFCTGFRKRLLKKDSKKFKKFVETTNTHGVRQIFIGKSLIRKIFWGLFFLVSLTVCLVNISRSIQFYISIPTATTVTSRHVPLIRFPAVTVCNMHLFRTSYLDLLNLTDLTRATLNLKISNPNQVREEFTNQCIPYKQFVDNSITLEEAIQNGGQRLDEFIVECEFLGVPCDFGRDFTSVMTPLGLCYTFNGRNDAGRYKNVSGIGYRHGLELVLNVQQDEFAATFTHEAGARVVIHNQDDPPSVLENGLAVPIGQSAYMSIRARQIDDRSETGFSNCYLSGNQEDFELVQSKGYSLASCLSDCILKDIANVCKCIHGVPIPSVGRYANYQKCSVVQICCIAASIITTEDCGCTIACNQSLYDATTTYSTFPALAEFAELALLYNTTQEVIKNSFLSVRVFFSELIMVTEITERSYSLTALIADIGGQLGLFLGASIISMTEFLTWILDEFKDRCFGITETKTRQSVKRMTKKLKAFRGEQSKITDREMYHDQNGTVIISDFDASISSTREKVESGEGENTSESM